MDSPRLAGSVAVTSPVPLNIPASVALYAPSRNFFAPQLHRISSAKLGVGIKSVTHHRIGKRQRVEEDTGASANCTVKVNGVALTAETGLVQVGNRGVWSRVEFPILFYNDLHMKQGWVLRRVEGKEVLSTVLAKRHDSALNSTHVTSARWSRPIGKAAIVEQGDVLELIELSTSLTSSV